MRKKMMGPIDGGFSFSSAATRFASLQGFMGGSEYNEVNEPPGLLPHEVPQNLEVKFNSGSNRYSIPSRFGPMPVTRWLYHKIK